MSQDIIVGLDIGTHTIQTVIAALRSDETKPQIIGVGESPTFGVRRGVVVDIDDAAESIRQSVAKASLMSGVQVDRAYVSLGGSHISIRPSRGVVAVSRADSEISQEDVLRAVSQAEAVTIQPNRQIIHTIPRQFRVDNQEPVRDPVGMVGVRLEVDALLVEASIPFVRNTLKSLSEAGIEPNELVFDVLASSRAVLDRRQKELGVVAIDTGGGTISFVVYEEGNVIHAGVLPIGAAHITNDLAIGLRTSIDTAEKVKLIYGSCLPEEVSKKEMIDLKKIDADSIDDDSIVSRREVCEIIAARVEEIFELLNKELKKIDRERMLPAGAVLVGAGAKAPGFVDVAKNILRLPSQLGLPRDVGGLIDRVDSPAYATAAGLVLWGADKRFKAGRRGVSPIKFPIGETKNALRKWLRNLLP